MAPFCGPLARDSAPLAAGVAVTTELSPPAVTVTSVDIVTAVLVSGGGAGRGGRRRAGRGPDGRGIGDVPGDAQAAHLLVAGFEDHERLAVGVETDDAARRRRADQQLAGGVERQRADVLGAGVVEQRAGAARGRHLVDLPLGAGPDVGGAVRGHRDRPDVLVLGVEQRRRRAVRRDAIDLAVRRRADQHRSLRPGRDRLEIQLRGVEQHLRRALPREAPQLAVVSGGGPDLAARGGDPPHGRRADVAEHLQRRRNRHPSVGVDRDGVGVALQEIGLGRDHPETGARRLEGSGAADGQRQQGAENGPRPRPSTESGFDMETVDRPGDSWSGSRSAAPGWQGARSEHIGNM